MEKVFPPPLVVGCRVWTDSGYRDHGPIEGPKIDIAPNMGGTITTVEKPYRTMDSLLYAVKWDNGQVSKHYSPKLFSIGRFHTREKFEAALKIVGPVELTLGPQGGFRQVTLVLNYDGQDQEVTVRDRTLWLQCLEPKARKAGLEIATSKLPSQSKRTRTI